MNSLLRRAVFKVVNLIPLMLAGAVVLLVAPGMREHVAVGILVGFALDNSRSSGRRRRVHRKARMRHVGSRSRKNPGRGRLLPFVVEKREQGWGLQ